MGVLGPDAVVRAPESTPPLHSLLATALPAQDPAGVRWEAGFEFPLRGCSAGGLWMPCADTVPADLGLYPGSGSGDIEQVKEGTDAEGIETFVPYVAWDEFTCTARDFQVVDFVQEAKMNLEASQHKQIEHEFWTGEMMSAAQYANGDPVENMSLQASTPADGVLNPGGAAAPVAVAPNVALALIQQGLANCGSGGRGVIHATAYLAELWGNGSMLTTERNRLMTMTRGTYVISGSGYPGTGPDVSPYVQDTTEQWVFATGMPVVRLGEVVTVPDGSQIARDSLDRRVNEITVRAERFAAVVWDRCCTVAVLVSLCSGGC